MKLITLRWLNYLRPNIKHGEFSEDEDRIICSLYANIGSSYFNPNSSSFNCNYNPNFLNVSNTINSHLPATATTLIHDHINVTDLFSPLPPLSNPNLTGVISNNNYYSGFQDDHCQSMINNRPVAEYYYYYPDQVKERMLMFGGGDQVSTDCSSSEGGGGGCMSQIKDHHRMIKQEEQFGVQGFEDQMHSLMTDEHKGYFKNHVSPLHNNLEEVKQLNNSSSSIISRYMQMDDDENKTTHIISDGCYVMIDGGTTHE
ncbi:Homeodomain-like protein [Cynara cardunculus var. scolymus]|uniref:Homeodomain-like protein n=1 Tax=Cynara cardunculus var. scolymus TaxID=59895 RepID=A0A103Y0A1_CYNCS|nr:Homeodomain-like protein [Cynara cardunculus var. scolymus]